jgi:hypothetical protein
MSSVFKANYGGSAPSSGGYLVDMAPGSAPGDLACSDVAWVSNAAAQV